MKGRFAFVPLRSVKADPVACQSCGRLVYRVFGETGVPVSAVERNSVHWLDGNPEPDTTPPSLLYGLTHRCRRANP